MTAFRRQGGLSFGRSGSVHSSIVNSDLARLKFTIVISVQIVLEKVLAERAANTANVVVAGTQARAFPSLCFPGTSVVVRVPCLIQILKYSFVLTHMIKAEPSDSGREKNEEAIHVLHRKRA